MSARRNRKTWLLFGALALVLLWGLWWWQRPQPWPLLVEHGGDLVVIELRLHGTGLERPVNLPNMAPGERREVLLQLWRGGTLQLSATSPRARVDARLLADVADLRRCPPPSNLQIGPGERYVLIVDPVACRSPSRH